MKQNPAAAKAAVTARACWEHYITGWRIDEIARELGISAATVRAHLRAGQDKVAADRDALAEGYVQRELDALDALERNLQQDLNAQDVVDDKGRVTLSGASVRARASSVLLEIKARRAKYLGLDKPVVVSHTMKLEDLVAAEGA